MSSEQQLEEQFIQKLLGLKYEYRPEVRNRAALEANFRQKFQELNRVKLTDDEFQRLLDEVVTSDVFASARTLRTINSFTRDDGTPLNYTLVNIKDWCKNHFEVIHQLRINTDNSHHRFDVVMFHAYQFEVGAGVEGDFLVARQRLIEIERNAVRVPRRPVDGRATAVWRAAPCRFD